MTTTAWTDYPIYGRPFGPHHYVNVISFDGNKYVVVQQDGFDPIEVKFGYIHHDEILHSPFTIEEIHTLPLTTSAMQQRLLDLCN